MSTTAAEFIKWLEVFNVDYGPSAGTGSVDTGAINELAYYAAAGDTVSGLATGNDGVLITSATGVPSISSTLPGGISATSMNLTTPLLGTPTSGLLTNCTGLPISTGVSGLAANMASFLATPSSANLAATVTDETGSGSLVFATSPTLVTPLLGTPTSGVMTNVTGLPLATGVTGVLPVANGGTNLSSTTINQILYSSAANTIAGLATANNALLVTGATGIPSIGTAIGSNITVNGLALGKGAASIATNIAFGLGALGNAAMTGGGSIAIGYLAGQNCVTGDNNISIGSNAGQNLTASNNTFIGYTSGLAATGCYANVALGSTTATTLSTGNRNVIVGVQSATSASAGGTNLTTASLNTLLGWATSADAINATGVIAIGNAAVASAATGVLSTDHGAGIAIGSASSKVGFRGDGSIYPSAGTSAGYMRIKLNGTQYKILLMADV